MNLEDLGSNIPDHPWRTSMRIDPYWGGVWQLGSYAQWTSRERAERMESSGIVSKRPKALRVDPSDALERINDNWEAKLEVLGALQHWRTATIEQIRALYDHLQKPKSHLNQAISDLFALDVIDYGSLWVPNSYAHKESGILLRPCSSNAFERVIEPRLSYSEWLSITGGTKFFTGGQYDRHNILATELALRISEFIPISTVLGERLSDVNTLAYQSIGKPIPANRAKSKQLADATIVREDGLRIAVEMSASNHGQTLTRKLQGWMQTLARYPVCENGLVVLFVVCERHNAGSTSNNSILTSIRKQVAKAARLTPGSAENQTSNRVFVVSWKDWFPGRGEASESFLSLTAKRPLGFGQEWERVSLLDGLNIPGPSRMTAPLAVAQNASGFRGTPYQLRQAALVDFSDFMLRSAGFASAPRLKFDPKTGLPRGVRPDSSYGVSGRPETPKRLLF